MTTMHGSVVALSVLAALVVSRSGETLASQAGRTPANPATTKPSLIGMSLSASANEDFFTFFRLQETMRESDAARRDVVVFKPGGGTFRKMVTVRVTLAPRERIVGMEVDLSRAFIDSSTQRAFANDIASSMLINSLPSGDLKAIGDLVNEIRRRASPVSEGPPVPGSVAIPRSRPIELPAKESPGFLTYDGRRDSYTQQLPTTVLLMEKMQEAGEAWLRIRVSAKS
jgi:hypothetical protein